MASQSTKNRKGEASDRTKSSGKNTAPANDVSGRRIITGISLIITSIILGLFIYAGTSGLLNFIVPFLKGLFGITAYVVPVIVLGIGIYLLITEKNKISNRRLFFCIAALLSVLHLIHTVAMSDYLNLNFFKFIGLSYTEGINGVGSGAACSVLTRTFTALIGKVGTIILFIGLIPIMLICATGGMKFNVPQTSGQNRPKREIKRARIPQVDDEATDSSEGDDFMPHSGKILTAADYQPTRKASNNKSKKSNLSDVSNDTSDNNDTPDDLDDSDLKSASRHKRRSTVRSEVKDDLTLYPASGKLNSKRSRRDSTRNDFKIGDSFSPSLRYQPQPKWEDEPVQDEINPPEPQLEESSISEDPISENVVSRTEYESDKVEKAENTQPTYPIIEGSASDLYEYNRPPLSLLKKPGAVVRSNGKSDAKAKALIETLASFGVNATIVSICEGPRIVRFEIQLAPGIRVGKVTTLKKDIGVALASSPVRIEAPIPGRSTIGIEIPSDTPTPVLLREVFESDNFRNAKGSLVFALGKDITGNVVTADLADMPHMLVAGTTGSGKSVCINSIILSLAYRLSPKEVRMILIDPKVVEFKVYAPLPHLFCPVVTDKNKAAGALRWVANEMDKRYAELGKYGYRKIDTYNATRENEEERWPRIVVIIDELSDLMLVAPKDVEDSILRISQLGRASGIHIIVATQRPSVDVITGTIKSNLPSKIAFAVSRYVDSNVILDESGAENLLGNGDMIFAPNGAGKSKRIQGAFVDDSEVAAVMNFFENCGQAAPEQDEGIIRALDAITSAHGANDPAEDEDLPAALRVVVEKGKASASYLQRVMRIGYAKASRLMDIMEQKGYVGPQDGAKPREIYITSAMYAQLYPETAPIEQDEAN